MAEYTVIDLFCGAGGFSEGFRQRGFKILRGIDRWNPAINTFNYNFGLDSDVGDVESFLHSISKIQQLPNTDVILGSPPCVTFSTANISGKADKKSGLLHTKLFLKVVAVKKYMPDSRLKAWYMENVVNSKKYLPDIYTFRDLGLAKWAERLGYNPDDTAITLKGHQHVINAAEYGAAQRRDRLISGEIVGDRIAGKTFSPPLKTHSDSDANLPSHITLGAIRNALPKPSETRSRELFTDPQYPGIKIRAHQLSNHFYDTGLYECEWSECKYLKTNHPYMGRMSFPENESKPARTVTATRIGVSRELMIFHSEYNRQGDGEFRAPTIREIACLMGFPITFQFAGSEGTKWKLIGNAVSPHVSSALAKHLKISLGLNEIEPIGQTVTQALTDLNTYSERVFDAPPRKNPKARFRKHIWKDGNMTVTLSNYDIKKNTKFSGRWITSIQYGTHNGFPTQRFREDLFRRLEPVIHQLQYGTRFIEEMNNGFLDRVGTASQLQEMYERKYVDEKLLRPDELLREASRIIERHAEACKAELPTNAIQFFKKKNVPVKQLLALYAISLITARANNHE